MARYDGTPESLGGFRDLTRDLNLDGWPDAPAVDENEDVLPARSTGAATGAGPASWAPLPDAGATRVSLDVPAEASTPGAGPRGADLEVPPTWPEARPEPPDLGPAGPGVPADESAAPVGTQAASAALPADGGGATPRHAAAPPVAPAEDPGWTIPPVPASPVGGALTGANSLTAANVLRTRRARPRSGWRKGVYAMSGGRLNLGPSPADRRQDQLVAQARTQVSGCHRLAVISLKGGVGKTTTTAALGAMLADLRGDRVIAVDANPDRGTLGERVPRESGATVRHLLQARDRIERYADVRQFTSQSPTRLEVLASDSDPKASLAYSEQDYRDTVATLERFYNLILTDCGTGLLHSAMHGVLGLANSLVVVSSASLDGARSASATLDWLQAHGLDDLAQQAVVVISSVRPGGGIVDVLQLRDHFAARCRDVVTVPYDPHLEAGGVLDLAELQPDTRDAYLELAAAVGLGLQRR